MASKHFKANTPGGGGVTVWVAEPSGVSREIRVEADPAYETDDELVIDALKGSSEVIEARAARASKKDDDD
jgi:hypothetical protein